MIVIIVKASQSAIKDTINRSINVLGDKCNLNFIDTELIINMSVMFYNSKFNGDISSWDVGNVTDMRYMFYDSKFNGDISNWNVGNVTNMSFMFYGCPLENRPEFQPKFNKK